MDPKPDIQTNGKHEPPKSSLDQLRRHLYDRGAVFSEKRRIPLDHHRDEVEHSWADSGEAAPPAQGPRKGFPPVIKIFFVTLLLCVASIGFLLYSFSAGRNSISSQKIIIDIESKNFVNSGEDLGLSVNITNTNDVDLILADLVVEYPTAAEGLGTIERIRVPIGTIEARNRISQEFDVSLFGIEGEERFITATLEYRIDGSNALLEKTTDTKVGIRTSPVTIVMRTPNEIVENQRITFDIEVTSNSLDDLNDVYVVAEYPFGFEFESANPAPSIGTNVWELGRLQIRDQRTITITGQITGEELEERFFISRVGESDPDNRRELRTIYAAVSRTVSLNPAFLNATISANGQDGTLFNARPDQTVNLQLDWQNAYSDSLTNVAFTLRFDGTALDRSSVSVFDGTYSSSTNRITWDGSTSSELNLVDFEEEGQFMFGFDPVPEIALGTSDITNPEVALSLDMSALALDGTPLEAQSVVNATIRFTAEPTFEKGTLYTTGPFPSSGPYPPIANEPTTYTIHWKVQNPSNNLSDARVITRLRNNVEWLGLSAPTRESLEFNPTDRTIIWYLGDVEPGAGYSEPMREVYFQIEATPSLSDIDRILTLTNEVVFEAYDDNTESFVNRSSLPHTSRISDYEETGNVNVRPQQ